MLLSERVKGEQFKTGIQSPISKFGVEQLHVTLLHISKDGSFLVQNKGYKFSIKQDQITTNL